MSSSQETVLVTGATRGIGAELLAQLLARKNTRVIAGVRSLKATASKKLIAQSQTNKSLIVIQLDSESDIDAQKAARTLQEEHGVDHVDLVIANAGIMADTALLLNVKPDDFRHSMNVNVVAPILLFQAFEPLLNKSSNPRILFISTAIASLGLQRQLPYKATTYGSSKTALNFVALRVALEHPNITSITLHPGLVQTDMSTVATKAGGGDIAKAVESGDAILPVDSAKAILKLADEAVNETHSGKFFNVQAGGEIPW